MFLLNSCLGHFSAAPLWGAPLLPKLRGHFAEFLNNASPAGLGILSLSTCVGLRYGCHAHNSGFSRRPGLTASLLLFAPHHVFAFRMTAFPVIQLPRLHRSSHSRLRFPGRVPTVLMRGSAGISTCSPSATPPGLALGPDSPRADQLYPGILGHPAWGILTPISLLIPAFSLPSAPRLLPVPLPCPGDAPLPISFEIPRLRWCVSAPDIFGADPLD